MITLKKLVFAIDKGLQPGGVLDRIELQKLTNDALDYLKTSKAFEYTGPIRLPSVAFKMVDLNMDLDDIVKDLVDKRANIEFNGTLSLIIEKENETKNKTA